jgi:hypothetical protein
MRYEQKEIEARNLKGGKERKEDRAGREEG